MSGSTGVAPVTHPPQWTDVPSSESTLCVTETSLLLLWLYRCRPLHKTGSFMVLAGASIGHNPGLKGLWHTYLSPGCWQRANGCQRPLGIAIWRCPMSRCSLTSTSVDFPSQCWGHSIIYQSWKQLPLDGPVTRRVSALAKEKRIQTYTHKPEPQVAWMDSSPPIPQARSKGKKKKKQTRNKDTFAQIFINQTLVLTTQHMPQGAEIQGSKNRASSRPYHPIDPLKLILNFDPKNSPKSDFWQLWT